MSLKNDVELANTRTKLARLEKLYENHLNSTDEDDHVRELSMRSLKVTINQFQDEIAEYLTGADGGVQNGRAPRNEQEFEDTQKKLLALEQRREKLRRQTDGDERQRKLGIDSLTRLINQFKEEIARYETRSIVNR